MFYDKMEYEKNISKIEEIIDTLDNKKLDNRQAKKLHQEGNDLIEECKKIIEDVSNY